jgi:hypothetical protein
MSARRLGHASGTLRLVAVTATIAIGVGCRNDKPPARVDTSFTAVPGRFDSSSTPTPTNGWEVAAGPVLLVAGPAPDEALVFFGAGGGPNASLDTGAVDQATATLFGRDTSRFTAHDIRRFEVAPGVEALAAHLTRRVNQEADPQEEQTLLIAERDSSAPPGRYQLAYAERSFGKEEQVSTSELVAAVRLGSNAPPTLVVARDGENGLAYALLERTGPRRWRVVWTSELAKCGG